jgi:8-oxo-dGTP diphosphatase
MEKDRPKIGIGVYILNDEFEILLMLRKNVTGAGRWCPPGGHFENGEEFIECVKREALEEVGLKILNAKMWAIVNNIMLDPPRHYVNLDFLVTEWSGEPKNLETEKCEKIQWFALNNLPTPLLEPTENFFKQNPPCLCQSGKKYLDCHGKI